MQSALDRIVHTSDVSWGRSSPGHYWVMWVEDGERQVREFRTAFGARRFADELDPLDRQPTAREIRAAERAIGDLEDELKESGRADLAALGVPIMTARQRRRADRLLRRVAVKRHVRKRRPRL